MDFWRATALSAVATVAAAGVGTGLALAATRHGRSRSRAPAVGAREDAMMGVGAAVAGVSAACVVYYNYRAAREQAPARHGEKRRPSTTDDARRLSTPSRKPSGQEGPTPRPAATPWVVRAFDRAYRGLGMEDGEAEWRGEFSFVLAAGKNDRVSAAPCTLPHT